jgi:hypothetical protein
MTSPIFAFKRFFSLLILLMITISSAYATDGPAGINGNGDELIFWLKADVGVIESGGKVSQWQDQSGMNAHVSQTDPNKQPTVHTNALNGQPVIRFDGIDDYLSVDIPDLNSGFSLFIVSVVNDNSVDGAGLFSSASLANPNTFQIDVDATTNCSTNYRLQYHNSDNQTNSVCSSTYANTPTITFANYFYNLNKVKISANGLLRSQLQDRAFDNTLTDYVIGTDRRQENFLSGDIAEIILYSDNDLGTRRDIITTYLSDKYDINLDERVWYGIYDIQTTGNHTSANAVGLTISNNTFLQENADAFNVMYKHSNIPNDWTTEYINDNIHAHWERTWYFYYNDANGNGGTIDLTFDFSDAGITESPTLLPASYQLVHRSGILGEYQSMDITATAIDDDKVIFTGVDVSLLNDRYYTLATVNHAPVAGFGTALNLDGEDDYVDLSPHVANIEGLNQGTLSGWFKTETGGTTIFSISESSANNNLLRLNIGMTTSYYGDESLSTHLRRNNNKLLWMYVRNGEEFYTDNKWHHFAIVIGNGNNRIYIDGINQLLTFMYGHSAMNEFSNINNPNRMHIGNIERSGHVQQRHFQGQIDELRIWDYPLSEAEIQTNMYRKLNGNEPGLLAYYPFENSANDMSLNTNDGTLANIDNPWVTWQTIVTEQGIPISGTLVGFDANGDDLTYEIVDQANQGIIAIIDPNSGEFIYTPDGGQTGIDTFTYQVCDTAAVCSEPATVTIEITEILNQQPNFTTNGNPPAISEDAGQQFVLAWVTEFNQGLGELGQAVADYLITNLSNQALFDSEPDVDNAGNLIYTPAANAWGTATFDVAVQDNGGTASSGIDTSESQTVTITINPVADTPSVTNSYIEPMLQSTDGLVITRNPADGSEVTHFKITQIDYGLLYQNDGVSQINSGHFITAAEGNAGLKFTSNSTNNGSFVIQASVSADDNGLGGELVTATIYVNIDNQPPILDEIGNQNVIIGNSLTFTATAHDPNIPPNNFFFKLVDAPEGAVIDPTTGEFTWTPTTTGVFTFTVEIEETDGVDGINFKDRESITITVNETTPELANIDDIEVSLTEIIRFTAITSDPEDHALTYSLNGAPAGAEIHPTTGEFSWTPTATGHFNVTVIVTDAKGFSDHQIVNMTVTTAPVLATIGPKETRANSELMFTADATHPGGNALTFSLENAPASAVIDPQTGVFRWTPSQGGTYNATIVVTETEGHRDSETITITVKAKPTSLDLNLDSNWIFKNASLDISGWLNRYPDTGENLENLPIQLAITAPDNTVTTVDSQCNALGAYTFNQLPPFDQKGFYNLQTHFAGNDAFYLAQSPLKSIRVRALAGYALLIQGRVADGSGQDSYNKSLNRVYRQMKVRGLTDDNIEYLNYNDNQTNLNILIDGIPTKPNIQAALQRLQAKLNAEPAPLYIVMVDHGSVDGNFHLDNGDGENIQPSELNGWLNNLENSLNPEALAEPRVAILGSCYSGSFIPTISQPGRVVITSATEQEESYKGPKEPDEVRSGEFFIEALFAQLGRGHSLKKSFELATQSTETLTQLHSKTPFNPKYQDRAVQHPLLDDNSDGQGSNIFFVGEDGLLAKDIYLGLGRQSDADIFGNTVDILTVTTTRYLEANQSATELFATINNPTRVMGNQVYVDIRSPEIKLTRHGIEQTGQLEINGLQRTLLMPADADRFTGQFASFQAPGKYELLYFAIDKETGELSPIKRSVAYKNKPGNNPPAPFDLLEPHDDSETATNLILDWEDTIDPDSDQITYTLILAIDPLFQYEIYRQEEINLTMTYLDEHTPVNDALNRSQSGLRDGTQYFWKIQAIDEFGARTDSEAFSFTTNNRNAPPSIASLHVSSAVNFTSLGHAVIDFWQLDAFGSPILDAFGNPIPVAQPPVIHQEQGFYNMLLPFGRRRVTINQPGMKPQEFDLDNTNGQTQLILTESTVQGAIFESGSNEMESTNTEKVIILDAEEGFKNLNVAMKSVGQIAAHHGQLQFSVNQTQLEEKQATVSIMVNRIGGRDGDISVAYMTVDGSAKAESDYQATNGTLTWANNETLSKRIPFTILNDSELEGEESLTLLLYEPTGGAELGKHHQIHITIVDDDNEGSLPITEAQSEDNSNAESESEDSSNSEEQGEAHSDSESQSEESSDSEREDEDNSDSESQDEGNSDSETQSEGYENENQSESLIPIPLSKGEDNLQFSSSTYTTNENDGLLKTITVTRTGNNQGEISAIYFTSSKSTATEGSDYLGEFGTLTWAPNDLQPKIIEIEIIDDTEVEDTENIHLMLFNATGNTGTLAQTTLTILDNDRATTTQEAIASANSEAILTETTPLELATVQFIADTYITEEGVGPLTTLSVIRQGSSQGEISVQYAPTPKSTATLDTDYTEGTGTLVWADGDMQPKPITLTLIDDEDIKGAEVIEIALSNLTGNVTLGETKRTVLIITDNEEISQSTVEASPNNEKVQSNEKEQANQEQQANQEVQPTENPVDLEISPISENIINPSEIEKQKLNLPSLGDGVVLQKPPLPDLGIGVVIIDENASRTALCSQPDCEVNSIFRGGVSFNGWDYQNPIQITPLQQIWIEAEIEVDALHVGQSADMLIGALYSPDIAQILPWWLIKDEQWGIVWWDGEIDHLLAASDDITLTPTQMLNIYQGPISEGYLQVFFGYRLDNGTIVYNGEQAIEIIVK